jgi:hypothetical protein
VPFANVHVPAPWHVAASHVAALAAHAACGSRPIGTLLHAPTEPVRLHALHPAQLPTGVSQQTVSTQLPEPQDTSAEQVAPSVPCAAHFIVASQ